MKYLPRMGESGDFARDYGSKVLAFSTKPVRQFAQLVFIGVPTCVTLYALLQAMEEGMQRF